MQRPDDPADAVEAVALMEQVVRDAASDAGAPGLLSSLDAIGVVQGAWKYTDPARLIADRVGATSARTSISSNGGNPPPPYLNPFANRLAAGEISAGASLGAEANLTRRRHPSGGRWGKDR